MKKRILVGIVLLALCIPFAVQTSAENENLVQGMAYTITNSVPTDHSYSNYGGGQFDTEDGKTAAGKLTDGVRSGGSANDSAWYDMFRSRSRYVTFAFDEPVAVCGMSASFLHAPSSAYYAPRYVSLLLSEDGENWFTAGTTEPDFSLNGAGKVYEANISTETYKTKYVRVEFCVDIFAKCDEIEIYGSKTLSGGEKTFSPDSKKEPAFCTSLGEISDIIKIYNGYYPSSQDRANNTVEELLPYVAYLSADGEIKDTMFDAVAFVPCVSTDWTYPSGGTLVKTSKYPSAVQSDWIYYTDFLFASDYDLDALNQAVKQTYETLGIEGKFPVLLTMPYVAANTKAFGDLDGDGKQEYSRTAKERTEIVKWYNEYLTKRFADANFSHLEFAGYYWYSEEVNYTWSDHEAEFVKSATNALEEAGKYVLYDPFYLSTGFDHWKDLGFDGAVMQPNVAFTSDRDYFDTEMLWEFAETIGAYNLGVEIETNEPGFFANAETLDEAIYNYERYLYVGAKTGYMDALHTFYQSAGPGTIYQFCKADAKTPAGIRLRRLYDITYRFIKCTYENEPPVLDIPEAYYTPAVEKTTLELNLADPDSFGGDIKAEVISCENGRAQLAATKKYVIFLPDEGFVGQTKIVLSVTDSHNEPVEYTLTVNVGIEEPQISLDASSTTEPESEPFPWNLVVYIIAGIAVLAAVLVVLFYGKKK